MFCLYFCSSSSTEMWRSSFVFGILIICSVLNRLLCGLFGRGQLRPGEVNFCRWCFVLKSIVILVLSFWLILCTSDLCVEFKMEFMKLSVLWVQQLRGFLGSLAVANAGFRCASFGFKQGVWRSWVCSDCSVSYPMLSVHGLWSDLSSSWESIVGITVSVWLSCSFHYTS